MPGANIDFKTMEDCVICKQFIDGGKVTLGVKLGVQQSIATDTEYLRKRICLTLNCVHTDTLRYTVSFTVSLVRLRLEA